MFAHLTSATCVVIGFDTTEIKSGEDAMMLPVPGMTQPCVPKPGVKSGVQAVVVMFIRSGPSNGVETTCGITTEQSCPRSDILD